MMTITVMELTFNPSWIHERISEEEQKYLSR